MVNENQTLYDVQICPETREAHKYIGVAIHIFLHKSIRENAVEDDLVCQKTASKMQADAAACIFEKVFECIHA